MLNFQEFYKWAMLNLKSEGIYRFNCSDAKECLEAVINGETYSMGGVEFRLNEEKNVVVSYFKGIVETDEEGIEWNGYAIDKEVVSQELTNIFFKGGSAIIRDIDKKPGEVLENGYTIVEKTSRVVLAHKVYNESEGQYATWRFDVVHGSTCWGNYYRYGTYCGTKEEAYNNAYENYLNR